MHTEFQEYRRHIQELGPRSLSVKQILAGEYFARPDPEAFQRILNDQHLSATRIVVSGRSSRATTAPDGAQRPGRPRQLPSMSPSMPALHAPAPAATGGLTTSMSAPALGLLTRTAEKPLVDALAASEAP